LGVNRDLAYGKYSEPLPPAAPPLPVMSPPALSHNVSIVEVRRSEQADVSTFFPPPPPPIFGLTQIGKQEVEAKVNDDAHIYY